MHSRLNPDSCLRTHGTNRLTLDMTQDKVLDMKDVELNEIDPEKQPMATGAEDPPVGGGGEKNGVVKVKLEDEDDDDSNRAQKFTGLSKEELLKVAGTPGWVKVRWALLILFWLGWLGMLAGAVVIIVQAPRCRPLPVMEWWNKGPLYQLGDPDTFQDSNADGVGDIAGIQDRLDSLSTLKVKGLVIGPLHATAALSDAKFTEIDTKYGTVDDLKKLLEAARKKSIQIILDLTPNDGGSSSWSNGTAPELLNNIKEAMNFWLDFGVGGIYFNGIESIDNPGEVLEELRNITANHSSDGKARVLLTSAIDPLSDNILTMLNDTAGGLLTARYLINNDNSSEGSLGNRIKQYQQVASEQDWILWAVRPRLGHMASAVHEKLLRVYQLLLFTLQGTPLTLYGDEIGLKDLPGQPAASSPYMQWDDSKNHGFSQGEREIKPNVNENITFKGQEDNKDSILSVYKRLSELRGKERSLLHGDFTLLHQSDTSLAYERSWDQNERFVSVVNFDPDMEISVTITHANLPEQCTVVLSSNSERKEGSSISLKDLKLVPGEALLLKHPYSG
ncbi:4F2 cell-surface antigen heavy chain-like [Rana temporaria]|uniref:4F2 cell-surface antigen heavy chain-like n=1 Tax=Rana temporaria TaxID=8407 RepID=UPI001AAD61EC|nr:4F2 cell-surface antigen heavy chain-like [Rana temporaria]